MNYKEGKVKEVQAQAETVEVEETNYEEGKAKEALAEKVEAEETDYEEVKAKEAHF